MISFEEARGIVLNNVAPVGIEPAELLNCLGRVSAEDMPAPMNLPSFDNSAMDGYAVCIADCHRFASLAITGYIPAGGVATTEFVPGSAIKIMTGAPVPPGCNAIVPLEDAEESDNQISIKAAVHLDQHIRHMGEDVKRGDTVVPAGTLIRPPEISMLASLGRKDVKVYRKPVVAILATGDELVEPGQPLTEGKVFNSNSLALAAAVREAGATSLILGAARDNQEDLRHKIACGLQADVLITAAGVSVGDRDLVREVLADLRVKELFWQVNIKPGKSVALGINNDGKPVFSLPGNPVSAMVTFEELVRPALLKMMGHRQVVSSLLTAVLQEGLRKKPGKIYFARVAVKLVNGVYWAWSAGNQDTGFQRPMLRANALAILPADCASLHAGEEINVHMLSNCPAGEDAAGSSANDLVAASRSLFKDNKHKQF